MDRGEERPTKSERATNRDDKPNKRTQREHSAQTWRAPNAIVEGGDAKHSQRCNDCDYEHRLLHSADFCLTDFLILVRVKTACMNFFSPARWVQFIGLAAARCNQLINRLGSNILVLLLLLCCC
jgi:hypothetical protein